MHLECSSDANMSIVGVTNAKVISFNLNFPNSIFIVPSQYFILSFTSKWYGAPPPFSCGPPSTEHPFTGFWDTGSQCKGLPL